MSTVVNCPACGRRLEVPPDAAGKTGACDTCGKEFVIPAAAPPVVARPATPVAARPPAVPVAKVAADPPWWDYRLLRTDEFFVRRDGGGLNYRVIDGRTDRDVGFAREKGPGGGADVMQAFGASKAQYPCTVRVYDARTDDEVFSFHREKFARAIGYDPARVDVDDGDGKLLGGFGLAVFPARGPFWVYDRADKKFAEVDGTRGPEPDYEFLTRDGERLGRVTAEGSTSAFGGVNFSWVARGGELRLKLRPRAADDPEAAALLLATTLALESLMASVKVRLPR